MACHRLLRRSNTNNRLAQAVKSLFLMATRGFQTHYGFYTKQSYAKLSRKHDGTCLSFNTNQIRSDPMFGFQFQFAGDLQEYCVGDPLGLKQLLLEGAHEY